MHTGHAYWAGIMENSTVIMPAQYAVVLRLYLFLIKAYKDRSLMEKYLYVLIRAEVYLFVPK